MKNTVEVWFRNDHYIGKVFRLAERANNDLISVWDYIKETKQNTMLFKILSNGTSIKSPHEHIVDL